MMGRGKENDNNNRSNLVKSQERLPNCNINNNDNTPSNNTNVNNHI